VVASEPLLENDAPTYAPPTMAPTSAIAASRRLADVLALFLGPKFNGAAMWSVRLNGHA
jgi:hypothetical protein